MLRTTILAAAVAALAVTACASSPRVSTARVTSAQVAPAPPPGPLHTSRTEPKTWGPIEEWRAAYPMAARTLDSWADEYPDAARRIASWDQRNPQYLEVVVDWALTYPHERLGALFLTRSARAWDELSGIARDEPDGVEAFLQWARHCRLASEQLSMHPGGLGAVSFSGVMR